MHKTTSKDHAEKADTAASDQEPAREPEPSPAAPPASNDPAEGQGVKYYYGGLGYDATVTKVHDADTIDLSVATDEHTFTREQVKRAGESDHEQGRWTPATPARKAGRK